MCEIASNPRAGTGYGLTAEAIARLGETVRVTQVLSGSVTGATVVLTDEAGAGLVRETYSAR